MLNHLEILIKQYYEWKDYLVRNNVKVGKREKGGWECELDIVAYHPGTKHLLHIEPSLDAHTWERRELRFGKKFDAGRKFIFKEVFPWLDTSTHLEQIAVLITASRQTIAGGKVVYIDQFIKEVKDEIAKIGIMGKNAISEQYHLLRTIQMVTCGYYKLIA